MIANRKILFVHSSADLYGSDRCLLSIVRGLIAKRAAVHVVVPENGQLVELLKAAGAEVHLLDTVVFRREMLSIRGMLGMILRAPVSVGRLALLIRRERIDLVHTNTGVTVGGAIAARLCRVPHVWHFREILAEFRGFMRLYEPVVDLFSTRLIFITGAVKDSFSSKRIKRKGMVIYDGIPVEEYEDTAPESADPPVVVTTVGRLAPYKGQDVMIRALAGAVKDGVDLEAYIVGDVYGDRHAFRQELVLLAARLGIGERVHFMGFQDRVQPFLEKCNIFMMPATRQEPLGIVILEAMAAGRAVISTNGGGAVEIITDGVDGVLVPPGDSSSMAEAISELAADTGKRREIARQGKQTALEQYSEDAMVSAVIEMFDEVLSAREAGGPFPGSKKAGIKST
ncbi:MAG: glycosyltransferase [Thermoleophilia bacterium]